MCWSWMAMPLSAWSASATSSSIGSRNRCATSGCCTITFAGPAITDDAGSGRRRSVRAGCRESGNASARILGARRGSGDSGDLEGRLYLLNLHRTWVFAPPHQAVETQGSVVFRNEHEAPGKAPVDLELRRQFALCGPHHHLIAIRKTKLRGVQRAHLDIWIIRDRIQNFRALGKISVVEQAVAGDQHEPPGGIRDRRGGEELASRRRRH